MKINYTNFGRSKSIEAPDQVLEKYHRTPKILRALEFIQFCIGVILVIVALPVDFEFDHEGFIVLCLNISAIGFIGASISAGLDSYHFRKFVVLSVVAIMPLYAFVDFSMDAAFLWLLLISLITLILYLCLFFFYAPIVNYYLWTRYVAGKG